MGFKVAYDDEQGILHIRFTEDITPEDICEINKIYGKEPSDKTAAIIVDISDTKMSTWATPWDRETRQRVAASVPPNPPKSRVAIIGSTSISRMLTKVGLSVIGRIKDSRFFKNEAQAVAWLKE